LSVHSDVNFKHISKTVEVILKLLLYKLTAFNINKMETIQNLHFLSLSDFSV